MSRYVVPELAQLIHRVPHVNTTLHHVSGWFNTSSVQYTESLLVVGCVPALWLVLTLLLLLVYLLSRCCCGKHKQRHSFVGLKWTLGFTAVLTCGAIAAGFYGNHTLHQGASELVSATENIANTFVSVKNETVLAKERLMTSVNRNMRQLQELFLSDSKPDNATIVSWLDQQMLLMDVNVSERAAEVRQLSARMRRVQDDKLPVYVRLSETIRWPAVMALLGLLALACLGLLVGVVRHSRCLLISFSVASLFAVILCYLLAAVLAAATLGVADFCVWPDRTVRPLVASQFPEPLSAPAAAYYLNCTRPSTSPWAGELARGQRQLGHIAALLESVYDVAVKYYPSQQLEPTVRSLKSELNRTAGALARVDRLLLCEPVHDQYQAALDALCRPMLTGATVLLLALLVCGLLFTVLAWCDAHAWIHIQKRSDYLRVETIDPFLAGSRRPPLLPTAPPGGGGGSLRSLRTSPHGSLLAARNHSTPPTLRTRTPPFPSAAPPSGPLMAFNGRMDEARAGTLPRRYSPAPGSPPAPPSYTATLMQMNDLSDYDNYS